MFKKTCLAMVVASLVLAGCSSRDAANESNFSEAINQHFKNDCISVTPRSWSSRFQSYPVTINMDPGHSKDDLDSYERRFGALVDAGLLKVTKKKQVKVKDGMASILRGHDVFKKRMSTTFDLTSKGKKNLSPSDATAFCAGHYVVDKVYRFTKPTQRMGYTVSNVAFEYSSSKAQSWAKSKSIRVVYRDLEAELAKHGKSRADLVLTNKGWVHVGDMDG